jgi:predicted metalloprotease
MWEQVFAQRNLDYAEPRLVLFRGLTQSACGGADARSGPHYCSLDRTIYLDETFFDEMRRRFGVASGDVAQAYVIAHEVGHHAQEQMGILARSQKGESVEVELQADCFAGLWAYSIRDLGVFEPGELQEALDLAAAVGDDRVQRATTGRVREETWTHGSSEQRVAWFSRGAESGSVAACDTFGG